MKKNLLINSKKFIYLMLFSSGALFTNNVGSANVFQAAPIKAKDDTIKKVTVSTVTNLRPKNIPVLYGEQSESRLIQSISYLAGKKMESSPVSLLSNNLGGQLAGLNVIQSNGAPRFDNPDLSLRGRNPLIIVDGVPRFNLINQNNTSQTLYDVLSLNPEQIESVVLLKDALSTVMLGNRAMNGVLMVTTRKAGVEKNSSLTFTGQAGMQTPIGLRKPLSSFDYASLFNEASVNDGGSQIYSQSQLDAYKNGTDPFASPDVNWLNTVLKKNAPMQRYNLTASGNNTNLKYFLSLDYLSQGGLLKEDPAVPYGTNIDYTRYILRSNIELNINKRLSVAFNLLGNIQDFYQPGVGYDAVMSTILTTPNLATPVYNFRGSYSGSRIYPNNPYAQAVSTGYLKDNMQAGSADIIVKQTMDNIVKGTWLKAVLSYSPSYEQQIDRSKGYNAYNYPVTGDTLQSLRVQTISDQLNAASVIERFQQTYVEFSAGIDRNWNKNAFTGLLLASYDNSQGDNTLNQIYQGLSARMNYSYDNRINVEVAGAYSGNNRFSPNKQYDFFPAVGASWNLKNEKFFKNNFFDEFKLRASYGTVGNANPGYYLFYQSYSGGSAYFFGSGATSTASIARGDLVNPNRMTEKANKLNVGFDLAFSHQRGWVNFDYYNNSQFDLLQTRGNATSIVGSAYPLENIGKNRYFGIEVNTGWADKIGKLSYTISANLTTVGSRVIFNDEPTMNYPWLAKTGRPVNQIIGYVADGFFTTDNLNLPSVTGHQPAVGDVIYKDLNNDGIIDFNDQTIIGNKKPLIYYGANLSLQYSGFDLNVLFQGVSNRDLLFYDAPFSNNGTGQVYQYNVGQYNLPALNMTLPRVTLATDVNNYVNSSLFIRNAGFIRLKNVEIGFSFSNKHLLKAKIKGIRVFMNGQNLLTFTKFTASDPEDYNGLYPIQQIINGGLSIKL